MTAPHLGRLEPDRGDHGFPSHGFQFQHLETIDIDADNPPSVPVPTSHLDAWRFCCAEDRPVFHAFA